jgi:predicted GNAT family N-acyltransferase
MHNLEPRPPANAEEFARYYAFRHRLLREPWGQPPGSERDELEAQARHLMVTNPQGEIIGVGRLHFDTSHQARIRYMAVAEDCRGQGIGRLILAALEEQARAGGAHRIVLDAREPAERFYARQGYHSLGEGHTLFGHIPHVRMAKDL